MIHIMNLIAFFVSFLYVLVQSTQRVNYGLLENLRDLLVELQKKPNCIFKLPKELFKILTPGYTPNEQNQNLSVGMSLPIF